MITVKKEVLIDYGCRVFEAVGVSNDEAAWVTDCLVRSNLKGVDSHGVERIPGYVKSVQNGRVKPGAKMKILRETPAITIIDGFGGFGYSIARQTMELTIKKARKLGVAFSGVQRLGHIGRVGRWTEMALEQDMIGVASQPGGVYVAPWGGIERKLPINPISVAIPTGYGCPFIMDFSMGPLAGGRIRILARRGIRVPPGWLIDEEGNPTQDPSSFVSSNKGAQLPLGQEGLGYKGYALSMVLSTLTGPLIGAYNLTRHRPSGVFLGVINIAAFTPIDEFKKSMDDMIADIKSSKLAKGFKEILIAGEPEFLAEQRRLKSGIPIDNEVWQTFMETAESVDVDTSMYKVEAGGVSLHPSYTLKHRYM
jgi:LDH2 family malate/lactate/ureidoglycolate dehydrogenase